MPVISTEAKRSVENLVSREPVCASQVLLHRIATRETARPSTRKLLLLAVIGIMLPGTLLSAQSSAPFKPAFFIAIDPNVQTFHLGTKVTIKATLVSTESVLDIGRGATVGCSGVDLVHVELEGGKEPEKTEFYRHLLGDFRPGDVEAGSSGSCFSRDLMPGGTLPMKYDLSAFYKFAIPGKYDVWVQINDTVPSSSAGTVNFSPVRSNVAHFELVTGQ